MADPNETRAFRYAETLTLGIYRVTDHWPRGLGGDLATQLRLITPAISDSLLDGCSWRGPAARSAWRTALRLLERLADGVDRADRLGLLDPEATLELLEAQSGASIEVLALLEAVAEDLPGRTSASPWRTKIEGELPRAA